jgi:hypothetical protein
MRLRLRRVERGDAGADFGTSWYSVLMFGLLIAGLMIAVLGFWRAASAAATEREAYVAGTRERVYGDGRGYAEQFFGLLTGQGGGASVTVQDDNSTVTVAFKRRSGFWAPVIGTWEADQDATMEKYVERFRARTAP